MLFLVLLSGVLASAGCQWLAARSPFAPPSAISVVPTPLPQPPTEPAAETPDRYSAFRPIMSEPFVQPNGAMVRSEPVQFDTGQPKPVQPPPVQPDRVALLQIEELNREMRELKTQLAESQKQLQDLQRVPPPIADESLLNTTPLDAVPPTEITKPAEPVKLPIINRPGVVISSDESRRVRIEVKDKILFMPNVWQLTPDGEETLREIVAEIRAFDAQTDLDIEGHTDSLMGDPRNQMQKHEVASVKAKAVLDFFVNTLRWDPARIGSSSYGRSRPVADNGMPEGRERNNRIEIVLRKRGE